MKDLDIPRDILLPVICGFLSITTFTVNEKEFNYTIISRRESKRAGVRYHRRGSDLEGFTDNLYETEQIVTYPEKQSFHILSYCMVRGSLPLLWSQNPSLTYTPSIKINTNFLLQVRTVKKHLNMLRDKYGKVEFINLLSMKKEENSLLMMFEEVAREINKDREENIIDVFCLEFEEMFEKRKTDKKIEKIKNCFKDFTLTHLVVPSEFVFSEYNSLDYNNQVVAKTIQEKVYRFNCLDCIDRTNYTQYCFSKEIMLIITKHFIKKVNHKTTNCDSSPEEDVGTLNRNFEEKFKSIWIKNGDQLALSYCGTSSLTSTLIKKEKPNKCSQFLMKLTRFYLSNFKDGYNQDCLDYSLGLINSKNTIVNQHCNTRLIYFVIANIITIVFIYRLITSITFPQDYEDNLRKKILRFLFLTCVSYLSISFFKTNYKEKLIDKPSREFE